MRKQKMPVISKIIFIYLILVTSITIFLMFWGFMTSLKSVEDYLYGNPLLPFPSQWEPMNYVYVYQAFSREVLLSSGQKVVWNIWGMLYNSLIYAGLGALIQAFVPFLVAYVTSKYSEFKICTIINATVIALISLPLVGGTAPTIKLLMSLNLYNNHIGLLLGKAAFLTSYYLIYYAAWQGIPNEFADAASIDGASDTGTFIHVMIPMMYKMYLTVFLLLFVTYWNDFEGPLIYLTNYPVLALGVHEMAITTINKRLPNGTYINLSRAPYRMASSMLLMIPMLVVFSVFNKRLMGNLSMGGLKE